MSIIIGIDHGYYAIKTAHCSFPAGLTSYGEHEPYTRQGLLEFGGCFFVCGTGRQPIQRDKTVNDNYYLLTLAAIAKEIRQRGLPPECSVRIAGGLPLTSLTKNFGVYHHQFNTRRLALSAGHICCISFLSIRLILSLMVSVLVLLKWTRTL